MREVVLTDAPALPKIRQVELPKPEKRRSFTARQVAAVFIKYEGRCAKCNEKVALDGYHIDHINPLASLGKHELENWQLLCIECHTGKTKRDNFEAKKSARIRGEKGQQKRRRESGSRIKGRSEIASRPFEARKEKTVWPKRKFEKRKP